MTKENRSIVGRLIAKDLYLQRWLIAGALLAGVLSLVLSGIGEGDAAGSGVDLGFLLFVTTIIAFGIFVPMLGIFKERQDRSRLFVLSLPVSPAQYTRAKVLAALITFFTPWLALTVGVVAVTLATARPDGPMPFFVALMAFFLANFCTLNALVAISRSELWPIAGILVTNVSVTPFMAYLGRLPGVAGNSQDAVATWSPAVLTVLAVEAAWILLSLGLAFYLPSRMKDSV